MTAVSKEIQPLDNGGHRMTAVSKEIQPLDNGGHNDRGFRGDKTSVLKISKDTVSWLTETRHSFFVFERLVAFCSSEMPEV